MNAYVGIHLPPLVEVQGPVFLVSNSAAQALKYCGLASTCVVVSRFEVSDGACRADVGLQSVRIGK